MALPKGVRLGPYEILDALGAGGMGEVYRARDTRLGRDVAIKVLPAQFADDPDRLRRFEHEARAAAALNHSNILALYDVGDHDGAPYLVTELLEGESLRERIAQGALPVKEAVALSVQVARGLAAAHGRGIVHRDLKPENLFVTGDGTVKILDFGLATLRGEGDPGSPPSEALTQSALTRAGTVLGTAGYMAPEQVRGLKVDQRADIFAFGCVLYEMLTGRRAFAGDTPADTLGAILRDEPVGVAVAGSGVTQPLAELVRRCLEKRPENRFSSAHDLALALQASVSDVDARLAGAVAAAQPRRRRLIALGMAAAAVVLVAVAVVWLRGGLTGSSPSAQLDPAKVMVAPFENSTGDPSLDAVAAQVAAAITQGLVELQDIEVIPAPRGIPPGDEAALRTSAREGGAGTLVSGSCYLAGDTLELRGRITDPPSGKPIYVLEPERGPRGRPELAVERVRQRGMSAVMMRLGRVPYLGGVTRPPLYSAVNEWAAGVELLGYVAAWSAAVPRFEKAVELDPEFWTAQTFLLLSYRNAGEEGKLEALRSRLHASQDRMGEADRRFMLGTEASVDGRQLEALRQARALAALAPRDHGYIFVAAFYALIVNRPREALECVGDFKWSDWKSLRARPSVVGLFWVAPTAHHLLGEYEAELQVVRVGIDLYPDALALRRMQVGALAALGRLAEVERVINEAFLVRADEAVAGGLASHAAAELRAHGYLDEARRIAAQAADRYASLSGQDDASLADALDRIACLALAERWDEAHARARTTYEANPEDLLAQGAWGVMAAHAGDRLAAETIARKLAGEGISPATRRWVRARIAAQLGDKERAVELLRESLARGRSYVELHVDPYLEPLRGYPPFDELISPKG